MNATMEQAKQESVSREKRCCNPRCRRWLNGDYRTLSSPEVGRVELCNGCYDQPIDELARDAIARVNAFVR